MSQVESVIRAGALVFQAWVLLALWMAMVALGGGAGPMTPAERAQWVAVLVMAPAAIWLLANAIEVTARYDW